MSEKVSLNRKRGNVRKKKGRTSRFIFGCVFLLASMALVAVAFLSKPYISMYFWIAAGIVALAEALLLFKKRGFPTAIYIVLGLLCAALAFTAPTYGEYVPFYSNDDLISVNITRLKLESDPPESFVLLKNLQTLDLRGSDITDFTPFSSLTTLRQLDVRDNHAFTQRDYDALSAALPNCAILWSMPVAGRYYDSDITEIDLSDQNLSSDEIAGILQSHPQIRFTYALDVLGLRTDMNVEELDLRDRGFTSAEDFQKLISLLPRLRRVDLTGTPLPVETVRALTEANPRIEFLLTFDVPEGTMHTSDTEFALSANMQDRYRDYEAYFPYMPRLKRLDLRAAQLSEDEINRIRETYPDLDMAFSFSMFGVRVTSEDTKVVLDNIRVGSAEAVESYLKYLPHVKQIDMCGCGLSSEVMAGLRERHPEIKFVWTVHFAKWTVRTDIEVFTTAWKCEWSFSSATFEPLQYCTDLLFLDLGHDHVSNIEGVAKLKKLKVLILACNTITDISPLAELKDLEYLELFTNRITDFSALSGMQHLRDLNICRNRVASIEPILSCPSIERLWIGGCGLSSNQIKQLRAAFPKAQINTTAGNAPTTEGWRVHSHYYTIRQMYKTGKFIPWND